MLQPTEKAGTPLFSVKYAAIVAFRKDFGAFSVG